MFFFARSLDCHLYGVIFNTKTPIRTGIAMPPYKTLLTTESVRRYLLQIIAKSGTEPVRLEPERDLAEKLHVSRVTLRRAMESLKGAGLLMSLPGRKGTFTNPAASGSVEHTVGIVIYHSYVGLIFSQFLSGLSEELYSLGYNCSFTMLPRSENTPEKEAFELENSGCDCIVWHTQTPDDFSVINRMLADDYPVLTICNPNYPEWGHPERNWYALDMDAGAEIASFFLERGCTRPLFCSNELLRFRSFAAKMKEKKMDPAALFLPDPEEIRKTLPRLLKAKKIDGVYCSHRTLGTVLKALPKGCAVPILSPHSTDQELKDCNPNGIPLVSFDRIFLQKQCRTLGAMIARGIGQIFEGKISRTNLCIKGFQIPKGKG